MKIINKFFFILSDRRIDNWLIFSNGLIFIDQTRVMNDLIQDCSYQHFNIYFVRNSVILVEDFHDNISMFIFINEVLEAIKLI
jgi:hypothetical protein